MLNKTMKTDFHFVLISLIALTAVGSAKADEYSIGILGGTLLDVGIDNRFRPIGGPEFIAMWNVSDKWQLGFQAALRFTAITYGDNDGCVYFGDRYDGYKNGDWSASEDWLSYLPTSSFVVAYRTSRIDFDLGLGFGFILFSGDGMTGYEYRPSPVFGLGAKIPILSKLAARIQADYTMPPDGALCGDKFKGAGFLATQAGITYQL